MLKVTMKARATKNVHLSMFFSIIAQSNFVSLVVFSINMLSFEGIGNHEPTAMSKKMNILLEQEPQLACKNVVAIGKV